MPVSSDADQYATVAELALYSLRSGLLPSGVTDAEKNGALTSATGLVDSFLVARYELGLIEWGIDIIQATTDIAAYFLMRKYGSNLNSTDGANMRQGYEDALKWLQKIKDGDATPSTITTTDSSVEARDPNAPFVVSPAAGTIGATSGAFFESDTDTAGEVGAVGAPKLRGW